METRDDTLRYRHGWLAVAAFAALETSARQPSASAEVLVVRSGALTSRAQVWRPAGVGPFPGVLFNHGSCSTDDPLPRSDPDTLGQVFARHGYVFLWLHRQGTGLSSGQGLPDGDQMARALQAEGVEGRNRVQLQLLKTRADGRGHWSARTLTSDDLA